MAMKGERAGRFVLERRLGRGLEGEVWRARDSGGGAAAAVKLFTEPGAADAFRRSGAPSVPQQENLCRVLEAAPDGLPPFLAIEFVEGPTLREVLVAEGHVPLSAAIPTLIQVLRGLQALHREKLAHRDLRPENVIVDEKGHAKLSDVLSEGAHRDLVTRIGDRKHPQPLPVERAAAMAPYIAPELRRGPPAPNVAIDAPRADMYAFGVLAYEALTGKKPAEGFDVKFPSQTDKRIPKILDELIMPCLERSTRARTASALGLEAKLLDGLAKQGFDVFTSGDPSRWVRSTPWRAAGAHVGEETGKFTTVFKKLADEKK